MDSEIGTAQRGKADSRERRIGGFISSSAGVGRPVRRHGAVRSLAGLIQNRVGRALRLAWSFYRRTGYAGMAVLIILSMGSGWLIFDNVIRVSALTGTVRPDGDITAGWATTAGTSDATCSGAHCTRIDEATLDSTDYVATGTAGSGGEIELFSMGSPGILGTYDITSVTIYFQIHSSACGSTCDDVQVELSMDNGGSWSAIQTQAMTTTSTLRSFTYSGTWTTAEDMRVRFTRQVQGSGSPSGRDDDIRMYQVYATFEYTQNAIFEQSAYRWLTGANSVTPGAALAANNTALTGVTAGQQLRLRMLLHVSGASATVGADNFKLQYSLRSGTCDTSFSGEAYSDVTSLTPIRYHNNATPADAAAIAATADDPTHAHTITPQTYEESNYTTVSTLVASGDDGMWDFSLATASDIAPDAYCLRMVRSNDAPLSTYTAIAEFQMSPTVTAIAPSVGPLAAGTPFTLTGTFGPNTTVSIGGAAATGVYTVNRTTLIGVAPVGTAGAANVVVTTNGASATLTNGYTYTTEAAVGSRSTGTNYTAGTLTETRSGTIELDNGAFIWLDYTPADGGGSMASTTYYYVVTALDSAGGETARSVETPGILTSTSAGSVNLKWRPIAGARSYKVYRTTTSGTYGASSLVGTLGAAAGSSANGTIKFTDTAASPSAGTPPGSNGTSIGVYMSRGTVPGTSNVGTITTGPTVVGTAANTVGNGSFTLDRGNGIFLLVQANATTNTSVYTSSSNTFAAGPATGGAVGAGGCAFKLSNGNYVVIQGGVSTGTRIYDPVNNTFSAGPALSASAGAGALVIPRSDGDFLVVHGNGTATSSRYSASAGTFSAGPTVTASVNNGSTAFRRGDGIWLVAVTGTGSSLYDEFANSFSTGPTLSFALGTGSNAIMRPNGQWLLIAGANNNDTVLYNPATNTTSLGPTTPASINTGSIVLERPDGKWQVTRGNGNTATYIYDPVANSFATGVTLSAGTSTGSAYLQKSTGEYVVIHGNAAATTTLLDVGWNMGTATGTYVSEATFLEGVAAAKQLAWTPMLDGSMTVEYRGAQTSAGLAAAAYDSMTNGGTLNWGSQPWYQLRVTFTRVMPDNSLRQAGNLPGVFGVGTAGNAYRDFAVPTVQSISVVYDALPQNRALRHGEWFDANETRRSMVF